MKRITNVSGKKISINGESLLNGRSIDVENITREIQKFINLGYVTSTDIPDEAYIGSVGGLAVNAGGSVTRPNDNANYAIGDLIANAVLAASVVPIQLSVGRVNGGSGMIRALRLKVNDTVWKNATIRVHLFKDTPTVAVGDNGQLNNNEVYAFTESNYMGYCDITLAQQTSDGYVKGFGVRPIGGEWNFDCPSGMDYINALLETRTAITTPGASKIFTLVAETLQN